MPCSDLFSLLRLLFSFQGSERMADRWILSVEVCPVSFRSSPDAMHPIPSRPLVPRLRQHIATYGAMVTR